MKQIIIQIMDEKKKVKKLINKIKKKKNGIK